MDTSIGTNQQTLSFVGNMSTSARNYYVSRWVSPVIYQTSVAANTWNYAFSASESATSCNFPETGNNGPVYVCCYVWKPSDGTKYGDILDGNTASTVDEGTAGQVKGHVVAFTGSAVSSLTSGDACIVFEAWFQVTSTVTTSQTLAFQYDGTTEFTENATGLTQAASYIETPETLQWTAPQNITKTLSDTISISHTGYPTRLAEKIRGPSTQTVTSSETVARLAEETRTAADTTTSGDSVSRTVTGGGPTNIERGSSDTVTTGDSHTRIAGKWRRIGS
jgi:hypothetical protein